MSVYNSPLSQYAVMGFDCGYAMASPHTRSLWEAQFGDFSNGTQITLDHYRKPLIRFTPKAVSSLGELVEGASQPVMDDASGSAERFPLRHQSLIKKVFNT